MSRGRRDPRSPPPLLVVVASLPPPLPPQSTVTSVSSVDGRRRSPPMCWPPTSLRCRPSAGSRGGDPGHPSLLHAWIWPPHLPPIPDLVHGSMSGSSPACPRSPACQRDAPLPPSPGMRFRSGRLGGKASLVRCWILDETEEKGDHGYCLLSIWRGKIQIEETLRCRCRLSLKKLWCRCYRISVKKTSE